MSEPIQIGLIGCGPRALRGHVPGIQTCSDVRLVAVCDLADDLAHRTAAELGVDAYTDHRALLERRGLDAVLIVTATPYHAPLALDALDAGKHVFLEKPLAVSAEESERLRQRAEECGLVGAISYQMRFHPHLRWLHEQARQLEIVQALIDRPRGMQAAKYLQPGPHFGIMDYISHDLDLAVWLMGRPPRRLTALLQQGVYTHTGALENASVLLDFGDEQTPGSVTVQSTIGAAGLFTRYEVIGKHGSAGLSGTEAVRGWQVEAPGTYIGMRPEVEQLELPEADLNAVTAAMHSAFAAAIRGEDPGPLATFADGVIAMRLHEAVVDAGERREWIPFQASGL